MKGTKVFPTSGFLSASADSTNGPTTGTKPQSQMGLVDPAASAAGIEIREREQHAATDMASESDNAIATATSLRSRSLALIPLIFHGVIDARQANGGRPSLHQGARASSRRRQVIRSAAMRLTRIAVAAVALASMGCKIKVEAKPVGFKEGSGDTIVVHVVTERGAEISCSTDWCPKQKVPDSGEVDVDVTIPPGTETKRVFIQAKKGPRKGELVLDLATGLPPKLAVVPSYATVSCEPRKCSGLIKLVPAPAISISADPGTVFEIGADKVTVPAGGYVSAPFNLAYSPPLEKLPLSKICVGLVSGATTSTPLTTTTITATFPDKVKSTAKADFDMASVERDLSQFLKDVTKGPLAFSWEKAGAPARGKRSAVYVDGSHCYDAGANDAVVGDLDVVAVSESQERIGECTYTSPSSTLKGKITMHDENATVYDRITGKKLGSKLFAAPKECQSGFYAKPGEKAPDSLSFASKEAISRWAATFAK